jgi:hypothetical protein
MRFKLFVAALVTTLGLLLAGCGATQGTATSTATPEASGKWKEYRACSADTDCGHLGDGDIKGSWGKTCTLMSSSDAFDVISMGREVNNKPYVNSDNGCEWEDSIANSVALVVHAYGSVDEAKSKFNALLKMRESFGREDKKISVPGASEAWQHCGIFTSVAFQKGATIAELTLDLNSGYQSSLSEADEKENGCETTKIMAAKIASRI